MAGSDLLHREDDTTVATKKKEPFGGKQAKPFGKGGKQEEKKEPAKKGKK